MPIAGATGAATPPDALRVRLGTRGSALALAQSNAVADRLRAAQPDVDVEVIVIETLGDEGTPTARTSIGDKARFVSAIERALQDEQIDLAVHSAKDVPGDLGDGLALVAVPERADPRDALCGGAATLDDLPVGASVGTSSLRRRSQLLAARPDLAVGELRGNVDTRLRRLGEGAFDAILLAAAGLERLGLQAGRPIDETVLTPAPGQGCLALEARAADSAVAELAAVLTDRVALIELTAERAAVAALGATCDTPVGAHAVLGGDLLELNGYAGMPDGSHWIRDLVSGSADEPAELGRLLAGRMLAAGAGGLLAAAAAAP